MPLLSIEQAGALEAVQQWLAAGDKQIFRLFGYAGTGKTTLALAIADAIDRSVAFVSFTGKAALALQSKGCLVATTIHSLIYRAVPLLGGGANSEFAVHWDLREPDELNHIGLIIVDECSMVGEDLTNDLLSFGRPILAMGDPYQLPPIEGESPLTAKSADFFLKEVHRQSLDSDIGKVAAQLRRGHNLGYHESSDLRVISARQLRIDTVLESKIIICGKNSTRKNINLAVRRLRGFETPLPEQTDRLVCLKQIAKKG